MEVNQKDRFPQSMVKLMVSWANNSFKREFSVHKSFLCHYSPYFSKLLENTKITEIKVEDDFFDTFGIFVHWLYYQDLGSFETIPDFDSLCMVWKLAERFSVPSLQNCAVDGLHKVVESDDFSIHARVFSSNWESIFEIATEARSDVLRILLRDIMVVTKDTDVLERILVFADREMIKESFTRRVARESNPDVNGLGKPSDYYVPIPASQTG